MDSLHFKALTRNLPTVFNCLSRSKPGKAGSNEITEELVESRWTTEKGGEKKKKCLKVFQKQQNKGRKRLFCNTLFKKNPGRDASGESNNNKLTPIKSARDLTIKSLHYDFQRNAKGKGPRPPICFHPKPTRKMSWNLVWHNAWNAWKGRRKKRHKFIWDCQFTLHSYLKGTGSHILSITT